MYCIRAPRALLCLDLLELAPTFRSLLALVIFDFQKEREFEKSGCVFDKREEDGDEKCKGLVEIDGPQQE